MYIFHGRGVKCKQQSQDGFKSSHEETVMRFCRCHHPGDDAGGGAQCRTWWPSTC